MSGRLTVIVVERRTYRVLACDRAEVEDAVRDGDDDLLASIIMGCPVEETEVVSLKPVRAH